MWEGTQIGEGSRSIPQNRQRTVKSNGVQMDGRDHLFSCPVVVVQDFWLVRHERAVILLSGLPFRGRPSFAPFAKGRDFRPGSSALS